MGALLIAFVGRSGTTAAAPIDTGEGAELLRWRAPAGCPDEATMRARLAEALPPEVEGPRVEAEVVESDDGRFHAVVVLRGSWGETTRRLDSPGCDTLADAVVLLAAVSPSTAAGEPELETVEVPELVSSEPGVEVGDGALAQGAEASHPEPAPAPVQPRAAERSRPAERAGPAGGDAEPPAPIAPVLRGLARVEARAGAGLLPVVDLGGAVTLGLEHRWFRVELAGVGWLPRERTVAPDASVRASAWALELRGCGALRPTPWLVVLPCAELGAGQLRGEGRGDGLVNGRTERQPWLALGLGPAATVRLHRRVGVWLGAMVVVPLRRVGLGLEGLARDAHRMAVVSGRGALGLEVYF